MMGGNPDGSVPPVGLGDEGNGNVALVHRPLAFLGNLVEDKSEVVEGLLRELLPVVPALEV